MEHLFIFRRALGSTLVFALLVLPVSVHPQRGDTPIYLDPKQPIEVRVEDLMNRMTLKEKVGQRKSIAEKKEACKRFAGGTYTDEIGPGSGFFTLADTILHQGVEEQVEYFNALQKIATTHLRVRSPMGVSMLRQFLRWFSSSFVLNGCRN